MSKFRIGSSRFSRFMNGKGFYIALALCLIAIGSAAYIAVNQSSGYLSGKTASESSSASSAGSSANSYSWDSSAEQTNNTVSGVPYSSSSTVSSSSSAETSSSSSKPVNSKGEKLLFMMPCSGDVLSGCGFSNNNLVYDKTFDDYRVHNGIDISAKVGTPVAAVADGTVSDVLQDYIYGQEIVIDHGNNIKSIYGNLTVNVNVKKGQTVNEGDIIGAVGQTAQGEIALAPHLYLAMTKNGSYVDPLSLIGK